MQGKKAFFDKEVVRFRLSERVPRHNLYRRLAELVDGTFFYDETRDLYSHTGQPSLDPVVVFKLVLVGRRENLVSDRRLVAHCALRLDILFFLGYEVDEELPGHSTISRTRQLFPAAVFKRLFDYVFAQCVARGLVAGDTQAADSAPVKANAALEAMREKQPAGATGPHLAGRTCPQCPRKSTCVPGPSASKSTARFTTQPTAAPGSASRAGGGNANAASARAPSNPCLAT
jgi:transposase